MHSEETLYLQVALPVPLRRTFDYLAPSAEPMAVGTRVRVRFSGRLLVGVVVAIAARSSVAAGKIRPVETVLDEHPLLPQPLLQLALWSAEYYQQPIGELLAATLPPPLRHGQPLRKVMERHYRLSPAGATLHETKATGRSRKQQEILARLTRDSGLDHAELRALGLTGAPLTALLKKGLLRCDWRLPSSHAPSASSTVETGPPLNPHQQAACTAMRQRWGAFSVTLIEGVTGSGKTEIYLQLIDDVLARGQQALVLVPEIGLTPQLQQRFAQRFPQARIAVLHSGRTAGLRMIDWLHSAQGTADIILGTRSAIFVPMARPALLIVDEEHDSSYHQEERVHYCARDLAVRRGQIEQIPVLLGSATPSLESLANVERGRYHLLSLPERAGNATLPPIRLIDLRGRPLQQGFSLPLLALIDQHLTAGNQVLLFHNRRGYATALLCHDCGWMATCPLCEVRLVLHRHRPGLRCPRCDQRRTPPKACPQCQSQTLIALGSGTERCEETLAQRFPDVPLIRIDRDTAHNSATLTELLEQVERQAPAILVGTQMLAKGHHFPRVTLCAILDADGAFFSSNFRAMEQMAQLVTQVAGRAGRAERPGEVAIQTHHPDHPQLLELIEADYGHFAAAELQRRAMATLPPYRHLALILADAPAPEAAQRFLQGLTPPPPHSGIEWLGPNPAPIDRRGGRHHAQILLIARNRPHLQQLLRRLASELERLPTPAGLHWNIAVDPLESL
ncbi:MAG: primosomal protein N' [Pseudomonadales bacterium]|nr:primosomal protein N' [Pseudomonadales bacterium]